MKVKANVEPIFADLLQIMRFTRPDVNKADARRLAKEQLEAFCQRWASEAAFVAYFRKEWGDKLGALFSALWALNIIQLPNTINEWI